MIFSCRACAAKDAEIGRLQERLTAADVRAERQAAEIMKLVRETNGLPPVPVPVVATEPLPAIVDDFLLVKFGGHRTPIGRQQSREARKLLELGHAPEEVTDILNRGQDLEL